MTTHAPSTSPAIPAPPAGITFAAQNSLPKLPIPALEQTCQRYVDTLRPLQTARERAETERAVADFLAHDGPELQKQLQDYASDKTSYIEQFCGLSRVHSASLDSSLVVETMMNAKY